MYHVSDAGYLCGKRQGCMKGTRRDVLLQLEDWLNDEQEKHVFWLNGLAGTGKSTIAQTFAEMSFADGKLGASFFCSRDFNERSNLQSIFPTLAFQLAHRDPLFRQELLSVLKASPDVSQETLCSQMEKLIVHPFMATQIPTLIIIDALDECQDEEPASAFLSILSRYVDEIPLVKFFITGRPEPRIRSGFRLESLRPHTDVLRLHDVKPELVNNDIKLFFKTHLANIAKHRSDCDLTEEWPSSSDINILCKKAGGLFIYASTVVKFVASRHYQPHIRLAHIISLPQDTSREGGFGLDHLYTQVLIQAFCDADPGDEEPYHHFRSVIGALLLVFNPLSIKNLSSLLCGFDTPPNITTTLHPFHSLLLVPDNPEKPVQTLHKSFPDFLTNPDRCKDKHFYVDPSAHHEELLLSCLNLMNKRLKRNICNLEDYTTLDEVEDLPAQRRAYIGEALEYACHFWAKHLLKAPSSGSGAEKVQKAIDKFFTTHLLCWVEVLILMGSLNTGVYALNDISEWYSLVSCMWSICCNQCLHLSRQEFPANGSMTASVFSWSSLISSTTLLPRSTIMPSHFPLPHLGSTSTMLQSSLKKLRWSRGSQLDGGHVPVQLHWVTLHVSLHAGRIPLLLVYYLVISSSLMQSQAARWLFFLGTLMM
jgi:hypothetical protein